jgi:hypothetical protein
MDIKDEALSEVGWRVLAGGLRVFETSETLTTLVERPERMPELGLIIGGDVTMLQERMAICSTAMPQVQADESTLVMSFITSMVERDGAKGSGYAATTSLAGLTDEAWREAAHNAIAGVGGVRLPTGDYNVVFGREAVMEILHYILMPGLDAGTFYAQASPFMGKLGQKVASDKLNIVDDGAARGLVGSKGITDEGLPTGRTELIKDGVLVGLLCNWYESQRVLRDPGAKEKLGVDPNDWKQAFVPRNGFRYARGGGRHFDSQPGIHPTNVMLPGDVPDIKSLVTCCSTVTRAPELNPGSPTFGSILIRLTPKSRWMRPVTWLDRACESSALSPTLCIGLPPVNELTNPGVDISCCCCAYPSASSESTSSVGSGGSER